MGRTFIRQDAQIRQSVTYDDTITPTEAAFETNPTNLETDLNNIRSQLSNLIDVQAGNWYDDINAPSALDAGSQRGVNDLNTDLHALERKRVLVQAISLADVTVGGSDNFVILGAGELPPNTTAAVGAVTTTGTVVAAHGGTFGTHALDEVSGGTAISPKNIVGVVSGSNRDPILDSSGKVIYGLLQGESGLTDGTTITDTTTTRVQVSFVVINAAGDDLEACAAGDIQGQTVNFIFTERKALEDLTEQEFLKGASVDVPGASTINRQVAYDNQGTTAVNLTTNATLDLEGAGLVWKIRDDLEADLFVITEGSAGGTSEVQLAAAVDTFNVDAVVNDFLNGASFDTGAAGTTIDIGVTGANAITSGGALALNTAAAGDLTLGAGGDLIFSDENKAGGSYGTPLNLSDASTEWDDFETAFGEVSLLNAMVQAYNRSSRTKGYAVVTSNVSADTDVANTTAGNLDADLPDYSGVGSFVDDVDVYLNGELLRNGANAAANHDVYPGTTPAVGMLKFEFGLHGTGGNPDQLCMIVWNS